MKNLTLEQARAKAASAKSVVTSIRTRLDAAERARAAAEKNVAGVKEDLATAIATAKAANFRLEIAERDERLRAYSAGHWGSLMPGMGSSLVYIDPKVRAAYREAAQ